MNLLDPSVDGAESLPTTFWFHELNIERQGKGTGERVYYISLKYHLTMVGLRKQHK